MDDKLPNNLAGEPGEMRVWMQRGIIGIVGVLVIMVYGYAAYSGPLESANLSAGDSYYNSLVDGFRAGQLNLKKAVPPGFMRLADPYAPAAHQRYPLLDTSYYKGKLYLYFGITPALVLFWPVLALTGNYLLHRDAVVIFCSIGFLTILGLLSALWRRYFATVSVGVVAAGILAVGLATGLPLILAEADVWEVSISCGYAFVMLALVAIWMALHHAAQRGGWLAAASLTYGLAVGARPSWLFGAAILLMPVVYARRQHRPIGGLLLAATGPIMLIGVGLLLYNFWRFDNPLEFGLQYQLTGARPATSSPFSLRFFWFNFRVFFLAPAHWSSQFPFVQDITLPPVPAGQGGVSHPFGALTNIPLVWFALAAPLFYRCRTVVERSLFGYFLAAVVLLFAISALTLSLFSATTARYEVEFLSTLVLLAVIGILNLERGLAGRPLQRKFLRWGWSLFLGFSVAFNIFTAFTRAAEARCYTGKSLYQRGQIRNAIVCYEQALRCKPDHAESHNNLGIALMGQRRFEEAIEHYKQALRYEPDSIEALYNLGVACMAQGRVPDAIGYYEQVLLLNPDHAEAQYHLGVVLTDQGRLTEAIWHYEQALHSNPDFAEAHFVLGGVLLQTGKVREAVGHCERALHLNPNLAEAHYTLGLALTELNRIPEAIHHYEQALHLKPDFDEAQRKLVHARAISNSR